MLYEVITEAAEQNPQRPGDPPFPAGTRFPSAARAPIREADSAGRVVITSYSIHYTKLYEGDSCGIVGWYVNTIAAPIDGESDATIELFNITNQPLTLDNAAWEDGNTLGIYSLQTALPITIQPHNPAVPSSGKAVV